MLKKTSDVVQAAGLAPLIVSIFTKLAVLVPPWLMLGVLFGFSALSHQMWGKPPGVAWAAMAGTLATIVLTGLTFLVSHSRGWIGRTHSTLSTFSAMLWFTIATITGATPTGTLFMWFFGGITLAIGWNIRAVIRIGGHADGPARSGDALGQLFDSAKESFGLKNAKVKTKAVSEHKINAVIELPPGEKIASDAVKRAEHIESGMRLPVGSVSISGDPDDASKAFVTVTDPRLMRKPIPWPGPSAPGGSIALPLRLGVHQDAETALHPILGHHTQVMGMSGSGKSIGGCWNYLGEIISRYDVAVFAIDTSKGEQTLGPIKPGLHRLETTKGGALAFIHLLHQLISQRTQWLTEHGYTKWVEGCGLLYWVIWIEEAAKFWGNLSSKDEDLMLEVMKELRSAGGTVVNSLQRSTHTEMPTLARGQHAAFVCFKVAKEEDAEYGLSDDQQEAEARPHQFKQPGMAYMDHPHQPATHLAIPLRTWDWALGVPEGAPEALRDKAAVKTMREYAVQFPARVKGMDIFTAKLAAFPDLDGPALAPAPEREALDAPARRVVDVLDTDDRDDDAPEGDDLGELLAQSAELIIATQFASASMLARKLRLPIATAVQILEALEMKGVVGPQPAGLTEPREVLVSVEDGEAVIEGLREDGHPIAEYVRTEDPDPEVVAGPFDEIAVPTLREDQFHTPAQPHDRPAAKMPAAQARALVHAWVAAQGMGATFTATHEDLTTIRTKTGNKSRGWTHKVLDELVRLGALDVNTDSAAHVFTVVDLDPIHAGRELVDA